VAGATTGRSQEPVPGAHARGNPGAARRREADGSASPLPAAVAMPPGRPHSPPVRAAEQKSLVLVLALWAAGLGAAAQFAKVSVIFPVLQGLYPDTGATLGFAVSLLSVMGIVFGLFAGLLAARVGFRTLLLAALCLGAAVSFLQATTLPLPLLLASRVLEGLSHLTIVVSAPTLIGQLSPPRFKPAAMTLWSTFFGVAFAAVAWLGIPLTEARGPASLFLAHGAYLLVMAGTLMLLLPKERKPAQQPGEFSPRRILQQHLDIYRSPSIAAPATGWLFYTLTFVSLMTLLPDFVVPDDRRLVAVAMPLAGMFTAMTVGVLLLRRFAASRVVILGFSLAATITLILMLLPGNALWCIALMAALGLVQGASFASIPELNASIEHQAYANGAVAQMGNLGNTCGTPLLLLLIAAFGHAGLIGFLLCSYGLGIAIHLLQGRRRRSAT
jgi:MFS transporter, DHA1 family, inner membrane transport protein